MNILILGGGITGLSAAWFLSRKNPKNKITLLEKDNRLGGWIRTNRKGGMLFEQGPRTFQLDRSPHLLQLIRELNLQIITSAPLKRYLWHQGRLRSLGSFLPGMIPYLVRELFIRPSPLQDESIYDFAVRRFSHNIAETLFDPLTLGIYAGDMRQLSIRSCFPAFFHAERVQGSLVRSFLFSSKKQKGLFTVSGGMETLIEALQKQLPIDIVFNCKVEKIREREVLAGGKLWQADRIISALPLPFPAKSLWIVNLAFAGDVLRKKGFGYLVPTKEKEPLLGVIFDSAIFPQQNNRGETRLTAMVRSEEPQPLQVALCALERHLGITASPIYSSSFYAQNAIPQFEVGCGYSEGLSVDASIRRGGQEISVQRVHPSNVLR